MGWVGRLRRHALFDLAELNVFIFAVLLNFPWEMLQSPLFKDLAQQPHWEAVKRCTVATGGDGLIMLVAFWCTALVSRTRAWILQPSWRQLFGFTAVGLAITIVAEHFATTGGWSWGWAYAETMPVLPGLGTGLSPFLQWVLLPPATVWFVRRQLT